MTRNLPGTYGVDAPRWPIVLGVSGTALLTGGIVSLARKGPGWNLALLAGGASMAVSTGLFLHTTRRGKFVAWAEILDGLGLRGDERVLDLGCGRGMVLIQAAQRLTSGTAVGVDLWRTADQSGNAEEVTRANARAAGVSERVELRTGDMTDLPFGDGEFDVVVSSLAIHNIPGAEGRARAIAEAARVLKPGGRMVIADFRHASEYRKQLEDQGWPQGEVRDLGWRFWYGGPWVGTSLLTAVKPAERAVPAPST